MRGVNKVIIVGTLGADAEKSSPKGTSVLKWRMVTEEQYTDKSGAKQKQAEWHSCVMFGKVADAVGQYMTKGTQLYAEGSIRTSTYEKNGEKRYKTEIIVRDVTLLGGPKGVSTANDASARAPSRHAAGGVDEYADSASNDDDEIPF